MKAAIIKKIGPAITYLNTKIWGYAALVFPINIVVYVLVAFLINPFAAAGASIVVSILGVIVYAKIPKAYKKYIPVEDRAYHDKALQTIEVLKEHGSLPIDGVAYFIQKAGGQDFTGLDALLAAGESPDLEIDYKTKVVSLSKQLGAALSDRKVHPLPLHGNYIAGYYQMCKRLELIQGDPELAKVPLDMLDTLYDTED
jgi:hypothetical protein